MEWFFFVYWSSHLIGEKTRNLIGISILAEIHSFFISFPFSGCVFLKSIVVSEVWISSTALVASRSTPESNASLRSTDLTISLSQKFVIFLRIFDFSTGHKKC